MQSCPTRSPSVSTSVPCLGFKCKNGTCIPGYRRCDHYVDCSWGEDEQNCGCKNSTEWKCRGSDKCIPLAHLCDKIVDCPKGEDEMQCPITKVPGNVATTVSPVTAKTRTSTTASGIECKYQFIEKREHSLYDQHSTNTSFLRLKLIIR